jgi:hypothetical protein
LVATLGRLAPGEREATVALIVHLAEFDVRRLYEPAGYPSLFKYCRAVRRLSEDAVYNRIETARAAGRYPVIVDMLVAGLLSPTTARLLARHLTPENHERLLAAASGMGKEDVEELLARWFPEPDVTPKVRKLPMPHVVAVAESAATSAATHVVGAAPAVATSACVYAGAPSSARPLVRPLSPDRYEIRFTATAEMREKLRLAQDLLGHAVPSGDLAQVFDRALTALVTELKRKKFAVTDRPRAGGGQAAGSRNIPAAVRRAVAARDGGACAFVSVNGHRRSRTEVVGQTAPTYGPMVPTPTRSGTSLVSSQ